MNNHLKVWGRKYFFGVLWPLLIIISLNYHQSLLYPKGFLAWSYYLVTLIGQYGLFALVLNYILYRPITLTKNFKLAKTWAIILSILTIVLVFIDSMVFAQYRYHLNGFILELLLSGAAQDIFDFPISSFLMVGAAVVVGVILLNVTANRIWIKSQNQIRLNSWYLVLILICQLVSNGMHAYARAVIKKDITVLSPLFPLYFPLTANSALKKVGFVPQSQPKFKQSNDSRDFFYPLEPLQCEGQNNLNMLVIVVDSWRGDQLNHKTTPYLEGMKKNSWHFNQHFSGSNSTRGGIFSLFYGIPSIYWTNALNNQTAPVWMEELLRNKYSMGIFAAASLTKPEFDQTVFSDVKNLRLSTNGANSVEKDQKLTSEWKEWLGSNKDNKFFGFLFYDSPHAYAFPKDFDRDFEPMATEMNYLKLNNSTDPIPYLNRHHKSVSFVDTLIEEVVEDLKSKKLADKTVIIITGDHGQELNDNKKNFWGHNSNYSPTQLKVPLLIRWPGKDARAIDQLTTHYDFAPTVMKEFFDCNTDVKSYSYGQNLFDLHEKHQFVAASYLDYAVLDLKKNQIMTIDQFGDYSVTDLSLNVIDGNLVDRKNLIDHFSDLSRFKKPLVRAGVTRD